MTKRTQSIEHDPIVTGLIPVLVETPLDRLVKSSIITAAEGAISWREGHLEHVARVYAADQRLAWRDYADDLTVALSADGGTFAALVDKARGE